MSISPTAVPKIDSLTGLRAFAAAAVFMWHGQTHFYRLGIFSPFYLAGAVQFFFALSGFILTVNGMRRRSWPDFLVTRVARIWPAHLVCLALIILAFWQHSDRIFASPSSLALNFLLLQDWVPNSLVYSSYNAVTWTLSVELFFYAAFPFLNVACSRKPRLTSIAIVALCITSVAVLPAIRSGIDVGWVGASNPFVSLIPFVLGMFAGTTHLSNEPSVRAPNVTLWTAFEVTVIAGAVAANGMLYGGSPTTPSSEWHAFAQTIAPSPAYAALIYVFAQNRGLLSRIASTRSLVYLGEISFSFYLVHQIVIRWFEDNKGNLAGLPVPVQFSLVAASSVLLAVALFHGIETPCRRAIVNAWKGRNRLKLSSPT